jgi:hypothetical protein
MLFKTTVEWTLPAPTRTFLLLTESQPNASQDLSEVGYCVTYAVTMWTDLNNVDIMATIDLCLPLLNRLHDPIWALLTCLVLACLVL